MIDGLKNLNLAVRFGLELAALAALAIYCWQTLRPGPARIAGAIGVPIVVMVIWASVVHGANVPSPVQVAVQVVLFAAAVAAVAALARPEVAMAFATTAVVNAALMVSWGQ